jgi:hypothetical protein
MHERIIAYFSRKLLDAETRYSTYDKELLAVRDSIAHWRYYLHGNDGGKFLVRTDYSSLQHILKQPKFTSRQMRLLETLQEYDFDIEYWPGAQNYVQDALSRRPDYKEQTLPRRGAKQRLAEVPDAGEILLAMADASSQLAERHPLGRDAGRHPQDCSQLASRHPLGRDAGRHQEDCSRLAGRHPLGRDAGWHQEDRSRLAGRHPLGTDARGHQEVSLHLAGQHSLEGHA